MDKFPLISISLAVGFFRFRQEFYFVSRVKISEAQRDGTVYLLFKFLTDALDFLGFPVGNREADIGGIEGGEGIAREFVSR